LSPAGRHPPSRARSLAAPLTLALAVAGACAAPDPKAALQITDIETYWAIDRTVGDTIYLAPVVRFHLSRKGRGESLPSIQAMAVFRRRGEDEAWGSAFEQVTRAGNPLAPGQEILVVLTSDGRYYSSGSPESMFSHELFKPARSEVFLRMGRSGWIKFGEADVENRIGSRSVQLGEP
jgi:hypothetical protein